MSFIFRLPSLMFSSNQYLDHYCCEVVDKDQSSVGHLLFTRYRYLKAEEDRIPVKWICKPDSYLARSFGSIVEPGSSYTQIPYVLQESISIDSGSCILIDELALSPNYSGGHTEKTVIGSFCEFIDSFFDFITVSQPSNPCLYSAPAGSSAIRFWSSMGFFFLSGDILFYGGSGVGREYFVDSSHSFDAGSLFG